MALTELDRVSALIVIDLQQGMLSLPMATPLAEVAGRAAALARAFRARRLPVVLVNTDGAAPGRREQNAMGGVRGPDPGALLDALGARPEDHRVTKNTPGAFTGTGLDIWLAERAVTQIVVAGVATGTGVEATARQAYELGFNVTCAIDAMTDMDRDVHANSTVRIFPRIGETGTTEAIVALLG